MDAIGSDTHGDDVTRDDVCGNQCDCRRSAKNDSREFGKYLAINKTLNKRLWINTFTRDSSQRAKTIRFIIHFTGIRNGIESCTWTTSFHAPTTINARRVYQNTRVSSENLRCRQHAFSVENIPRIPCDAGRKKKPPEIHFNQKNIPQ